MTPYDEKSSIQTTMFGLPQYQVLVPDSAGSITPASATESAQTLTLTVEGKGGQKETVQVTAPVKALGQ